MIVRIYEDRIMEGVVKLIGFTIFLGKIMPLV